LLIKNNNEPQGKKKGQKKERFRARTPKRFSSWYENVLMKGLLIICVSLCVPARVRCLESTLRCFWTRTKEGHEKQPAKEI